MLFKNKETGKSIKLTIEKSEAGKFINVFCYNQIGLEWTDWYEFTKQNLRRILKNLREKGFKRIR
jgi:hypothetical protein